ncbi:MAG: ECF-type sigma factor [Planctomycetota bacterium]|jgi:RNA polymerase sigma factor (TIGR02999 family)
MHNVTVILKQIEAGDPKAAERLLPLLYDELRELAAAKLAHEKPGHTLQATALLHEAYLRVTDGNGDQAWNSRGHFFGAAAEAMRRILIESARRKQAKKHGGDLDRISISRIEAAAPATSDDLLALDEALTRLEQESPRKADLVKLRYFSGLTIEQAAAALEIAPSTAIADWAYAKGWLKLELQKILEK